MTPAMLVDQYNRGIVTAMEAASWLLGNVEPAECEAAMQLLPTSLLLTVKEVADEYPLDDEGSLVVISNVVIPPDELERHRRCARETVPFIRLWFARHPGIARS